MKRIWIIGSQGMLGSSLVARAMEKGIDVIGSGKQKVDICSMEKLKSFALRFKPTHIINCAAYTDVDGAEANLSQAFAVNAQGAENAALVAQEIGAAFLHLSTDYVFGGTGSTPYIETDPCSPINVYGKSKREGETRVLAVYPQACIVRTSWVFGRQSKNLISSLLTRFLKEKELRVVSDQVGKPTYCFDLVEALFKLLDTQGIVHFANEEAASRCKIAEQLLQLAKQSGLPVVCEKIVPVKTEDFPTPASRPLYSVLDTRRYESLTSMKPRPWIEAAAEFMRHE